MEAEQKRRIIKRYLKEKSINPDAVNLSDKDLAPYEGLDKLLEFISTHNNDLFDFSKLEADDTQWQQLIYILSSAASFSEGSPPRLDSTNEQTALFGVQYWKNAKEISRLPKDNYFTRPVIQPLDDDEELNRLLTKSKNKLCELVQRLYSDNAFNPKDHYQLNCQIASLTKSISSLEENTPQKTSLQNKLTVLLDLNTLNHIQRLRIPQDHGPFLDYCVVANSVGGVTEKLPLMKLSSLKEQLSMLCERDELTEDEYNKNRARYCTFSQAIIKLPKRGNIKEVQREAIALNISRLIGLDTSVSITVCYEGHPALFIPFDDVELLSKFSSGKTLSAGLGILGHTYTHYSTITPVGEGLQGDCYISDFGHALGLLYLCSDTDAIGGYCQNKALRDAFTLFIFDQVISDTEKFLLDSRLCLQPDQFIMKHTRHGQGRNRTLIEDSSMNSKFASLMQLKELGDKIIQYVSYISWHHRSRIEIIIQELQENLEKDERSHLAEELKDLQVLDQDAELLKSRIANRIAKIDSIFPKSIGSVSNVDIRQALILEKLVNNPVLFTDDGRAYKNPWTNRHSIKVTSIEALDEGQMRLTFSDKIPESMLAFIKRQGGGDSIELSSHKTINLSNTDLHNLTETLLHPEHRVQWDSTIDYLDSRDLDLIKLAYGEGNTGKILGVITEYQSRISMKKLSRSSRLEYIKGTEAALREHIQTANDKGFGMHVLKKFGFEAQQQLQKMMGPSHLPQAVQEAFKSAVKLDRVTEFNRVTMEALACNKITDAQFELFLENCIKRNNKAINYKIAKNESQALADEAKLVIKHLRQPAPTLALQLSTSRAMVESEFRSKLIASDVEDSLIIRQENLSSLPKTPVNPQNEILTEDSAKDETGMKI